MSDSTVKVIKVQFAVDETSFRNVQRMITQLGTDTKKTIEQMNTGGGVMGAITGTGTGKDTGTTSNSQKLAGSQTVGVNIDKGLSTAINALRRNIKSLGTDIKAAMQTMTSSMTGGIAQQIQGVQALGNAMAKTTQQARTMAGSSKLVGQSSDWNSPLLRGQSSPWNSPNLNGGSSPWGGGWYRPEGWSASRHQNGSESFYGSGPAEFGRGRPGGAGFGGATSSENTADHKTNYAAYGAAAVAAGTLLISDYANRPFEDMENRGMRGQVFGERANRARMLTPQAAKEMAAMKRLAGTPEMNMLSDDPVWRAAAKAQMMAKTVIGNGSINPLAIIGNITKAVSENKFADSVLAANSMERLQAEVNADPVGNAAYDKAYNGYRERIGAMNALGIGDKYDKKTGTWTQNVQNLQTKLRGEGLDLGAAISGFNSVEGAGGYGTAQKHSQLAMYAQRGHLTGAGNFIGAAAQMGMAPSDALHRLAGTFKDPGAAGGLGSYVANRALADGTRFNTTSFLGALAANAPATGDAGEQMYMSKGIANYAERQRNELFGGGRDQLQQGINLQNAYGAGATGVGAMLLANNPNVQKWVAQVAGAKDKNKAMPEELRRFGVTPDQLLAYGKSTLDSDMRYGGAYTDAYSANSELGKHRAKAKARGMSWEEYQKTLSPKERRAVRADELQADRALEGPGSFISRQDAEGFGMQDLLNPKKLGRGGLKDPSAGSRDRAITKQVAVAEGEDDKGTEKITSGTIKTGFDAYRKGMEGMQRDLQLNVGHITKSIEEVAKQIDTFAAKLKMVNGVFRADGKFIQAGPKK